VAQTKYFTVTLPCKPYIKKYVGAVYGDPFRADHSTPLGCYINIALEKKNYENRNISNSFVYTGMNDKIAIQLNRWQFTGLGYSFSNESVKVINRFLEEQFEEDLYKHCYLYVINNANFSQRNNGLKDAINMFCQLHNITTIPDIGETQDISMDGLVKKERRARAKHETLEKKKAQRFDC
jgi:hypothetical protein